MSQLKNLNNIISENNVIGNPFDTAILKLDEKSEKEKLDKKSEKDKKIFQKEQISQNLSEITIKPSINQNSEELNRMTQNIFGKKK